MTLYTDAGPHTGAGRHVHRRPEPARRPPRVWTNRLDLKVSPYLYVAPFFVLFGIFGVFPLLYTAYVSVHDWDLIESDHPYVGLDNYTRLLADPEFWNAVGNTCAMFVIATVPQMLLSLWIASLLNRKLRARTTLRMSVVIPNITSTAAVAIIFGQLFSRDFGIVNWLLNLVGIDNIHWQASKLGSWIAISAMVDWRWTGYNALIFLAAMQAIPRDLYESAAIDGATRRRQFWSITVPMLKPTLIFCVIISTIGGLQLFTEPLLFNGSGDIRGGPDRESQTITMYMFENAFAPYYNFGFGSAVAWMLFLLIVLIAIVNLVILRRIGGESSRGGK